MEFGINLGSNAQADDERVEKNPPIQSYNSNYFDDQIEV